MSIIARLITTLSGPKSPSQSDRELEATERAAHRYRHLTGQYEATLVADAIEGNISISAALQAIQPAKETT
jgi:hypothetical protein